MASGRVVRIATRISIQVPEEGELHWNATAAPVAVPCTVAGVAARQIGVNGIVAIGYWFCDPAADLIQNSRRRTAAAGSCGVDLIPTPRATRANRSIRARVLSV